MAMKKVLLLVACWMIITGISAQTVSQRLQKAFSQFENDEQLKHAISSLYVIDANTGQVVFDKNSRVGLAPASTQKIITSVTAFELLGKEYRYKTPFFSQRKQQLYVLENGGDPTFGSWRYSRTLDTVIFRNVLEAYTARFGKKLDEFIIITDRKSKDMVPPKWIYEDIGNYYGTAPRSINWKENQYDITFLPGQNEGDAAEIDTVATPRWEWFWNNCITGKKGSGDNAYIYFIPGRRKSLIEGTVPAGVKQFTISASDYTPGHSFALDFMDYAAAKGIYQGEGDIIENPVTNPVAAGAMNSPVYTHYSPSLDSIVYWFNKKSINLYGEALVKTFAYEKQGFGRTDSGVAILKRFWKEKGLDEDELNMYDGSGLSPLNRVTTQAHVEILKYAKTRDWFPYFLNALPEYNSMTIKSGTITDVKGFCGYHKAKDGKEYIFSFLVNNYAGKASGLVSKMYKVLDVLK
jgi:D-alanyl-D-alanine carboxypeptidase/D-alanyl-D-alanine-endopeptidase (penicillin-binding protein 4)